MVRNLALLSIALLSFSHTLAASLHEKHTYEPIPYASSTSKASFFYNAALHPGADPYTFYDHKSGLYYAYSTSGQESGWLFAIYSSPDLSTWKRSPGGAMQACIYNGTSFQTGQICWAKDWHWAPEVYHNAKTGWYFLFFGGRLRPDLRKYYFQYSEYEEAAKIGVAVSRSPTGPFEEIEPNPIDYFPFDPDYYDINLIMEFTQRQPPLTKEAAKLAPKGTYLSSIDPNLYISKDAKEIYLYFSRAGYRHWNWDLNREKFIEESAVMGVQLTTDWWNDPEAKTMPTIIEKERDRFARDASPLPYNITSYNGTGEIGYPPRKDGWTPIITYGKDPQYWENDSIDDYSKSNGILKDRRFAEGSTCISRVMPNGTLLYLLTYSANFFMSENYGVGLATALHPLGPFTKSSSNPILYETFELGIPIVSTGHGSIVASRPFASKEQDYSGIVFQRNQRRETLKKINHAEEFSEEPDTQESMYQTPQGSELFYVHHGRNSTVAERALYTTRLSLKFNKKEGARMTMYLTASDQPLARGTEPISINIDESSEMTCSGRNILIELSVLSGSGSAFELAEASNRVVLRESQTKDDLAPLYSTLLEDGRTSLVLFRRHHLDIAEPAQIWYQRKSSTDSWRDVAGTKMACE